MNEYYKGKLEAALEYQDYVSDMLRKEDPCIIVGVYSSKKYQEYRGESASGIEIKYDMVMGTTRNVYIEVAEKSDPSIAEFTPSGIMRNDNSYLYLIGDYYEAFLFSKSQLKAIYADKKNYAVRGIKEKQTETSIGFTYPIENALKYVCIKHFVFKERGEV